MSDTEPHVHTWTRDLQPCACGQPVPAYLAAAWARYAANTEGGS
jgi:hypothetical protein